MVDIHGSIPLAPERPPLLIQGPDQQRRWTIAIRLPLLILHIIVGLALALVGRTLVAFCAWVGALVTGRIPVWTEQFVTGYLDWAARFGAAAMLMTDHYPALPFAATGQEVARYPVKAEPVNRLAVLFRFVLLVPAELVYSFALLGWYIIAIPVWIVVLILGRMPAPLFDVLAALLRYGLRFETYFFMVNDKYPMRFMLGDTDPAGPATGVRTQPLRLSQSQQVAVVVILVLGLASYSASFALDNKGGRWDSAFRTYRARDHFQHQYASAIRTMRKCHARIDCLQGTFTKISLDADHFADRIGRIGYPSDALDDANSLQVEARLLAQTAISIATAPGAKYNAVLQASQIDAKYERVFDDATALGKKLD